MITLPIPARRHWVSAFAASLAALLGLAGAVLGLAWGVLAAPGPLSGPLAGVAGAVVGLILAALLLGGSTRRYRAYRLWARLSRRVSDLVAGYLTRLLFGVVTVAGLGGSSFRLEAPRGAHSNWTPKSPVPAEAYASQHTGGGDSRGSWSRSYASWALGGAGVWALFLYPLIALLGVVQTREKGSFGGNVYTLY